VNTDPQIDVVHFIPSVTLRGTREQKLQSLDLLLNHLRQLRTSLTEDDSPEAREIARMRTRHISRWRDVCVAGLMLRRNLIRRVHEFFTASSEHRYEPRS
jgi:hypothetical protein